jgi:hypothetical protein
MRYGLYHAILDLIINLSHQTKVQNSQAAIWGADQITWGKEEQHHNTLKIRNTRATLGLLIYPKIHILKGIFLVLLQAFFIDLAQGGPRKYRRIC